MKKLSITIISIILFLSLIGCQKKTETSAVDVTESNSDINTKLEGNVTVQLLQKLDYGNEVTYVISHRLCRITERKRYPGCCCCLGKDR